MPPLNMLSLPPLTPPPLPLPPPAPPPPLPPPNRSSNNNLGECAGTAATVAAVAEGDAAVCDAAGDATVAGDEPDDGGLTLGGDADGSLLKPGGAGADVTAAGAAAVVAVVAVADAPVSAVPTPRPPFPKNWLENIDADVSVEPVDTVRASVSCPRIGVVFGTSTAEPDTAGAAAPAVAPAATFGTASAAVTGPNPGGCGRDDV